MRLVLVIAFVLSIMAAMFIPVFRGMNDRQEIDKANVRNIALINKGCPQANKAVEYYNTTAKANHSNITLDRGNSNRAALTATLATRYC